MVRQEEQKSPWERHLQTILVALVLSAVLYTANAITSMQVDLASIRPEIVSLQKQITQLQELTRDRYTKSDAIKDFTLRDDIMNELRGRVKSLEHSFNKQ